MVMRGAARHTFLRAALAGFGLGAAWGIAARVWMRVMSTTPEFSWVGSGLIVGVSGIFGAGVGVAAMARRSRGWRRLLRLAFLPGMVLFAGQGMPFLPAVVIGGPLIRRRSILGKVLAVVAIVGPAVLLWWTGRIDPETLTSQPLRVQVALLVGMPLLGTALAWGASAMWGPMPVHGASGQGASGQGASGQSGSPERARSSRLSDSSLEVPAGPA
jgi:hypothetical protein